MRALIVLVLLIFSPVALSGVQYWRFATSNPIFDKYKRTFEAEYYRHTKTFIFTNDIRINLVKEPNDYTKSDLPNKVGICRRGVRGEREIFIRSSSYKKYTEAQREELLFHELAHCALGYEHRMVNFKGRTISLMGDRMFSDKNFYQNNREALLRELFTGDVNQIIIRLMSKEK